MSNELKCPHCNAVDCIMDVAEDNVEYYGDNWSDFPCKACNKMIRVNLTRRVHRLSISKSNRNLSDSDF